MEFQLEMNKHNNNCDMNNSQRVVPGNRTYASATKYGKKAVVIGSSHLRRINRRLFNNALPNCKALLNISVVRRH